VDAAAGAEVDSAAVVAAEAVLAGSVGALSVAAAPGVAGSVCWQAALTRRKRACDGSEAQADRGSVEIGGG
jgi:hypothetical protein